MRKPRIDPLGGLVVGDVPAYWSTVAEFNEATPAQRAGVLVRLLRWAGFGSQPAAGAVSLGDGAAPGTSALRRAAMICYGESRGSPWAHNPTDDEAGICQFAPAWWNTGSLPPVPRAVQWDPYLSALAMRAVVSQWQTAPGEGWRSWYGPSLFHSTEAHVTNTVAEASLSALSQTGPGTGTIWSADQEWLEGSDWQRILDGTYGMQVRNGEGWWRGPGAADADDQTTAVAVAGGGGGGLLIGALLVGAILFAMRKR